MQDGVCCQWRTRDGGWQDRRAGGPCGGRTLSSDDGETTAVCRSAHQLGTNGVGEVYFSFTNNNVIFIPVGLFLCWLHVQMTLKQTYL